MLENDEELDDEELDDEELELTLELDDEDDLMMEQALKNQEHHSCTHWKPKAFEKKK